MKSASLNHVYRLVWSKVNEAWVAVAEFTAAHGKSSSAARSEAVDHAQQEVDSSLLNLSFKTTTKVKLAILASMQFLLAGQVQANPAGAQIIYGNNTITVNGATMTVNQQSLQSVINWLRFSIDKGETVNVLQPGGGSALYRVVGNDSSQIFGQLNATGKLFLVNPNGVLFGQGSHVDVGSLVVSTHNISTSDYLNNKFNFTSPANSNGSIVNQGVIKAGNEGYVVLLANQIENTGTITANNGSVVLGASQSATLDFYGNGLVKARLDGDAVNAAINQAGTISANGGFVQLATNARSAAINMSGVIEANSLVERDGVIRLEGGAGSTVTVSGQLVAKGVDTKGGSIQVTGEQVALLNTASLDASGTTGGGEVLVGGDYQGSNANVYNARTTFVADGASIKADATDNGDAGKVIVWSNDTTQFYGDISAQGGQQGGNGGFVEVSGKEDLYFNGRIDTSAANGVGGDVLLDPANIKIGILGFTVDNDVNYSEYGNNTVNINSALIAANNTTLQATNDIEVNSAITMIASKSITLQAGNDIKVNADITTDRFNGSNGNITLEADKGSGGASNGVGSVYLNANLTSGGGDITLSGASINSTAGKGNINSSGNLLENGGNVTVTATTGDVTLGTITANAAGPSRDGGDVTVNSASGNISVGTIEAKGADTLFGVFGSGGDGGNVTLTAQTANKTVKINNITTTGGVDIFYGGPGKGGNVTIDGNAVLASDTVINASGAGAGNAQATGGNVTFNGTVDSQSGNKSLSVNTNGITSFNGVVGGQQALSNLTTDAPGSTALNANVITTVAQTYNDAVIVGTNVTLTSGSGTQAASATGTSGSDVTFLDTVDSLIAANPPAAGDVTFNSTVDSSTHSDLTVNASGTTTFNGEVGGNQALGKLTTDKTGTTVINTGRVITNGDQLYGDKVQLAQNVTLAAGAGSAATSQAQDANPNKSLIVNATGNTTFGGNVGAQRELASLTTDAAGNTVINTAAVNTTGNQTYNDAVTVKQNATLTSGNDVTFAKAVSVDAGKNLAVNAANNITAQADITSNRSNTGGNITLHADDDDSGAGALDLQNMTSGGGDIDLSGQSITTKAINSSGNSAEAGGNVTATAKGNIALGNVAANAGANSAKNGGAVTVTSNAGDITVGTIESKGADAALLSNSSGGNGGEVNLTANQVTIHNITTTGGNRGFFGGSQGQGGDVTITGNTLLADNTVINASGAGSAAGGDVTFDGTVNGAKNLTVNTNGTTAFKGNVGDTTKLSSLTTDAAGKTVIAASSVQTTGDQTYNDDVEIATDTTLTATNAKFDQTVNSVNGTHSLAVDANGTTTFNGQVGNTGKLASLITDADGNTVINTTVVNTTGDQTYHDAVTVSRSATLTSGDDVTFDKTVNVTDANSLTVNATNNITANAAITSNRLVFGGNLTLNAGNALQTTTLQSGGGDIKLNGATINTGNINSNGNDFLENGGNVTANASGDIALGTVTANGNDGGDVAVTSTTGNIAVGAIESKGADAKFGLGNGGNGGDVTLSATVSNKAVTIHNITTTGGNNGFLGSQGQGGDVTINGNTLLADNVVVDASGSIPGSLANGGDVTFNGQVNSKSGAKSLTVDTNGTTAFNGDVGTANGGTLASLTTDAAGRTVINTAAVRTNGDQHYGDAVEVARNTTLTAGVGNTTGNVTFDKTVDSTANENNTLTVNADGATTFNGQVGNATNGQLGSLTTNAAGSTVINTDVVKTSGDQTYGDKVIVATNTTLTGHNVKFSQTVNSASGEQNDLTVKASGTTTFNGVVGGTDKLKNLTTDAAGTTVISTTSVNTSRNQTYGDAVTVSRSATLNSGRDVTFGSTVDVADGRNLTVNAQHDITAIGKITSNAILGQGGDITLNADSNRNNHGSLNTATLQSGGGNIKLNGATINTGNINSSGGNGGNVTADASGNITLGTVNANGLNGGDLKVTSSAGEVEVGNIQSNSGNVLVNAEKDARLGNIKTSAIVLSGQDGGNVTVNSGTGSITVGTIESKGADAILGNGGDGGDVTLSATATGQTVSIHDITTTGGNKGLFGSSAGEGGDVTINGNTLLADNVVIDASGPLPGSLANGGEVTFNGKVDSVSGSAKSLNVNTNGTTTFNGDVGSGKALASLTTDGPGRTVINAGEMKTTGNQTYNDDVTLAAPVINMTTTADGNIAFTKSVVAGANHDKVVVDTGNGGFFAINGVPTIDPNGHININSQNDFNRVEIVKAGFVAISDKNDLTLGNANVGTILAAADKLTLDGALNYDGAGIGALLVTNQLTVTGLGAINAVGGSTANWFILSQNPVLDSGEETLGYDFRQYGYRFGNAVLGAGSGLLYTVTPGTIDLTLGGSTTKPFDGNTSVTNPQTLTWTTNGGINGDTFTVDTTGATYSYDTPAIGTGKDVTATFGGQGPNLSAVDENGRPVYGYNLSPLPQGGVVGLGIGTITAALTDARGASAFSFGETLGLNPNGGSNTVSSATAAGNNSADCPASESVNQFSKTTVINDVTDDCR